MDLLTFVSLDVIVNRFRTDSHQVQFGKTPRSRKTSAHELRSGNRSEAEFYLRVIEESSFWLK